MGITEHDHLEQYLRRARVLSYARGAHGAHPSYRVLLEGGAYVIAKPAEEVAGGHDMVPREAAAWLTARALGWPELVGATVVRLMPSFQDPRRETECSLQMLWPDPEEMTDRTQFSEVERWRAGVFDVVIHAGDRSHNWLGVLQPRQLKLVDHGHAFEFPGFAFQSVFADDLNGQDLPADIIASLGGLLAAGPGKELVGLLGSDHCARMMKRVERLFNDSRLTPP